MAESKSMDVAKQGKSAPDATGRPVIVGHRPLLKQDPMVNSEETPDDVTKKADEKPQVTHGEKVITPPLAAIDTSEKQSEANAAEDPIEDNTAEQPISDDAAVVDAVAEQAGANKKRSGEQTEEEKKQQAALDKLIEEKKYFIPIKVASRKRHARWNIVILVILLIGAGGYLVLDAGLVKVPFGLPVHFFTQKEAAGQTAAVPAPQPPVSAKPALLTYKSTTDPTLSFQYPPSWQILTSKASQPESLNILSPEKTGKAITTVAVVFALGGDTTTSKTGFTVKDVKYTEIKNSNKKKLYLRELVYTGTTDTHNVRLSVTDEKGVEVVGGRINTLGQSFKSPDGKNTFRFEEVITYTDTSKQPISIGFENLQAAQSYMATSDYKDARSILLSAKFE